MKDKQVMKLRAEKAEEISTTYKRASGKKEYVGMLNGEYINRAGLIKAMCYHCCGYYADGKFDCGNIYCPIYMAMAYKKITQEKGEVKV